MCVHYTVFIYLYVCAVMSLCMSVHYFILDEEFLYVFLHASMSICLFYMNVFINMMYWCVYMSSVQLNIL